MDSGTREMLEWVRKALNVGATWIVIGRDRDGVQEAYAYTTTAMSEMTSKLAGLLRSENGEALVGVINLYETFPDRTTEPSPRDVALVKAMIDGSFAAMDEVQVGDGL